MESVREQISQWLDVETNSLNEIALEDVRFVPLVQDNLGNAFVQMLALNEPNRRRPGICTYQTGNNPCKGFWIEHTKELVLYITVSNQLKAVVVPHDGWQVRDDITLN